MRLSKKGYRRAWLRQADVCESEASLVYIVLFQLVTATW